MPVQERKIIIESATILKVIGILLVLGFLFLIRNVLALLFAAAFLAALMHPPARYLATKKIPKGVTVLVLYLLMFGLAVLSIGLLLPTMIDQSVVLLKSFGISWQSLGVAADWLKRFSLGDVRQNFQAGFQILESGQLSHAATAIFSTLSDFFGGLVGLVVVLVMAYYMVAQEQDARNAFRNFVPEEYQVLIAAILKNVEEKIGKWLLGQLSLCLIIGIMYFVGLSVIGLNAALVLALFGGFTEFIPYLGPILGAIPVIFIALSDSPFKAFLALIVLIVIQQFEGHVIVPKVMQKAVGLNPLVSISALLVGAQLFGVVGALLAIPVATAISAALAEIYRTRASRKSAAG